MAFAKGDRIKVIGGRKGKGVTGVIFWIGENKYGEGQRFGLRGDDGETYWVPDEHCEATKETMDLPEPPALAKGDRVLWSDGETERDGEVFWLGPNKFGAGERAGVKDELGETHWFDTRQLTKVEGGDAAPAPHPDGPQDDGSAFDRPPAFGVGPAWEAPPVDDAFAASVGELEGADADAVSDDDIPF